jgi:hypothetical protein
MLLGHYDRDRGTPVRAKIAEAVRRYEAAFRRTPQHCLTSPQDAAEVANDPDCPVKVQARGYIARFTYYVGEDADAAA